MNVKPGHGLGYLIVLLLSLPLFAADVPQIINFQGRLTDTNNNPTSGSIDFQFRLYSAVSGGTQLPAGSPWSESQTLTVTNGVFNAPIGLVTPIPYSVFQSTNIYLQITVEGENLAPRELLVTSPFAFSAQSLAGRTYDAFVDTSTVQTIDGLKTFSTFPRKSGSLTPTVDSEFATKEHVDDFAACGNFILVQDSLQLGSTFYVSSGTVAGQLVVGGNLGIGTASPAALLDVTGDGGTIIVPR